MTPTVATGEPTAPAERGDDQPSSSPTAARQMPARGRRRFWLNVAVNTVLFKMAWWVCVLGGAWGYPWAGVLMTLPALPLHAWLVGAWRKEAVIIVAAGVFGYVCDSTLVLVGVVSFPAQAQLLGPSPLWMVMLWLGFGATTRTALRFLFIRPRIAVLTGAIVGPLSYRGGEALDAIWIDKSLGVTLWLALMWSAAMLMLSTLLAWTDAWPADDEPESPTA